MFITEADRKVRAIHAKSGDPAALSAHRQEIFGQEVQGQMKDFLKAHVTRTKEAT